MSDRPNRAQILDLIGEFGAAVYYLIDDCETSWRDGEEIHTITGENLQKVDDLLYRIDALSFERNGYVLGTGAMLQEAIKQTDLNAEDAQRRENGLRCAGQAVAAEMRGDAALAYTLMRRAWALMGLPEVPA